MEDTSYHIYAKDRVLYCNLPKEDFEEKWQLLNVMVGLIICGIVTGSAVTQNLNMLILKMIFNYYIKN